MGFVGKAPAQNFLDHAVRGLLRDAPGGSKIARLKEQITYLNLSAAIKKSTSDYDGAWGPIDLATLSGFPKLTRLVVEGASEIKNIEALAGLPLLAKLKLHNTFTFRSRADASCLAALKGLEELEIGHCEALLDLDGLAGLTQLTSLWLESCEKLRDI